jgi:hypothetical protein
MQYTPQLSKGIAKRIACPTCQVISLMPMSVNSTFPQKKRKKEVHHTHFRTPNAYLIAGQVQPVHINY